MWMIILFVVALWLVHIAKMLRLYLVLMEHKIKFGEFLLMYAVTTLVNLILPFKIGEVLRFGWITKLTKKWQVGILSILVDRFFDTLAICVVLIPADLLRSGSLSAITMLFIAIMVIVSICYLSIMPTYAYLNHYIIREKTSRRAMKVLRILDVVKDWFTFTRNLIRGRYALIFMASLFGWLFEISALWLLTRYYHFVFTISNFTDYVTTIFAGSSTSISMELLASIYENSSALFMIVVTIVILLCMIFTTMLKKLQETT